MGETDAATEIFISQLSSEQRFGLSLGIRNPKRAAWTGASLVTTAGNARWHKAFGLLREWVCDRVPTRPSGLVICGNPGAGKTGLAIALLKARVQWVLQHSGHQYTHEMQQDAWIRSQPKVLALYLTTPSARLQRKPMFWYETWAELVRRVTTGTMATQGQEAAWNQYANMLVLDELDGVQEGMRWVRDGVLQEIVERGDSPHHRTILILNSPESKFESVFGGRIADRLGDRAMYRVMRMGD